MAVHGGPWRSMASSPPLPAVSRPVRLLWRVSELFRVSPREKRRIRGFRGSDSEFPSELTGWTPPPTGDVAGSSRGRDIVLAGLGALQRSFRVSPGACGGARSGLDRLIRSGRWSETPTDRSTDRRTPPTIGCGAGLRSRVSGNSESDGRKLGIRPSETPDPTFFAGRNPKQF